MKKKYVITVIACILSNLICIGQINIEYKWESGKTYRFKANQKDDITMSAMGINTNNMFFTETIFSLKVSNVLSNGSAEGLLYIESFKVTNKKGTTLASLKDIPKEALKSIVEVDTQGRFSFKKIIYLIVENDKNILVSAEAKAGQNSICLLYTSPSPRDA